MPPTAKATAGARTQSERRKSTIAALTHSARQLFGQQGFAATSIDEVAERAGMTKGAAYHHFPSKTELFAAVYEAEQQDLVEKITAGVAAGGDAWSNLLAGTRAFFRSSMAAETMRITLIDAPAALGWERLREIEGRYTNAMLRLGLQAAIDEGFLTPRPIEPLVDILSGALCETAMAAARSTQPQTAADIYFSEIQRVLEALRSDNPNGRTK